MQSKVFTPLPLFDTHLAFTTTTEKEYEQERPFIAKHLASLSDQLDARADYQAVRQFLKFNSKVETTYNNYRAQVERLLLWAWFKKGKSFLTFRRSDVEEFMDFCCQPDPTWVSPAIKPRHVIAEGQLIPNPEWRPFHKRIPKASMKAALEQNRDAPPAVFKMSAGSIRQAYAAINSLFNYCAGEQLMPMNPCAAIGKNKDKWVSRELRMVKPKSLSKLQWEYVLDTAEELAPESPQGERTLFCMVMMFSCYLRVSDLVGNGKWAPTMGSFARFDSGAWWYHVVGKGNVQDKIAVKPDCMLYLKRYRNWLGLPDYPYPGDPEPLLRTLTGRAGITARQLRNDVQKVFDAALERMKAEGVCESEIASLRSASLHSLRHTGATFDAPYRSPKSLQADMRHKSLATTQNIYYSALDAERVADGAGLKLRR